MTYGDFNVNTGNTFAWGVVPLFCKKSSNKKLFNQVGTVALTKFFCIYFMLTNYLLFSLFASRTHSSEALLVYIASGSTFEPLGRTERDLLCRLRQKSSKKTGKSDFEHPGIISRTGVCSPQKVA